VPISPSSNQNSQTYLFVYGTLKRGFPLHWVLQDSEFVGEAFVLWHGLQNLGVPTMYHAGNGAPVAHTLGELYNVTKAFVAARVGQIECYAGYYPSIVRVLRIGRRESILSIAYLYPHTEGSNNKYIRRKTVEDYEVQYWAGPKAKELTL
jgi:gamma-glutamylaminecyclotransferase